MGSNRDVWKSQDRECPPCIHCGTVLYEKFWGNGGWARTDKATDEHHGDRDCVRALKAQVATLREALQFYADDGTHMPPGHSAVGWCRDSGHRARLALGLPSKDE